MRATVSIGGNVPPVAANDSYSTAMNTPLDITAPGVLSNDTDANGDQLTAALVDDVSNGSLTLNTNGSFTYTPDTDYTGTDTFTYQANDGEFNSNIATVTITINGGNHAPVAVDDSYEVDEDSMLNIAAPGVLSNDYDDDGDSLTAVLEDDVNNGTLTLYANGSFIYLPDANYTGTDTFTYRASDGQASSNTATVTITIKDNNNNEWKDEFDVPVMFTVNEFSGIQVDDGISVNGGVFKTADYTTIFSDPPTRPTWVTTTDQLPSLSLGDLAIDPLDSQRIATGARG